MTFVYMYECACVCERKREREKSSCVQCLTNTCEGMAEIGATDSRMVREFFCRALPFRIPITHICLCRSLFMASH